MGASVAPGVGQEFQQGTRAYLLVGVAHMTRYWCLNFDDFRVLRYGLDIGSWLMQYQYECDGRRNQQHKVNRLTANWRAARLISVDDRCLAYLKPNGFYAAGQVIAPRKPSDHVGSVVWTLQKDRHEYLDGIVHFKDAPAFYEDYTDPFRCEFEDEETKQKVCYPYAQRVDVKEWLYARKTPKGSYISMNKGGLEEAVKRCNESKKEREEDEREFCMRDVVMEIDLRFYSEIEKELEERKRLHR